MEGLILFCAVRIVALRKRLDVIRVLSIVAPRLYVGNIPPDSSVEALRAMFSEYGEVKDVQIVIDRYSGRPRGFAFVTMTTPEEAARAAAKVNGTLLGGRPVRVSDARVRPDDAVDANDPARKR
jgi:RNA recognition motif-containing protein